MVEADRSDDADLRRRDVGGIEPAAQPCLQDRHVGALLEEMLERERGPGLERRETAVRGLSVDRFDVRPELRRQLGEGFLGYERAVHLKALPDRVQVRRGVEADAIAP